jgi:hypothetical protein
MVSSVFVLDDDAPAIFGDHGITPEIRCLRARQIHAECPELLLGHLLAFDRDTAGTE